MPWLIVIEHARIISIIVWIWFGLALFMAFLYHMSKRIYMWHRVQNISAVWSTTLMDELPEAETDDEQSLSPSVSVPCPTCLAKRMKPCVTLTGNLEMRLTHQAREQRYQRVLARRHTRIG